MLHQLHPHASFVPVSPEKQQPKQTRHRSAWRHALVSCWFSMGQLIPQINEVAGAEI
jgi:hypothetical protein